MSNTLKSCFLLPIFIPLLFGCSEGGPQGEPGPERLTGDAGGKILVYDEFGDSLLSPEGITVRVTGEGFDQTDLSDQQGNFLITGMQTGHYYMEFTKEGFGKEAFNLHFPGGWHG